MAAKKTSSAKLSVVAAKKSSTGKSATIGNNSKEISLTELVSALAETTGLTKDKARKVLDAHAELLINELKTNGSVQLAGIGKLKMSEQSVRDAILRRVRQSPLKQAKQ